jgi:predicted regulator of Ras-like GTPase activity (Roadblock/LC7/MglB family)
MAEDALLAELRALQDKVPGITGTAVASLDGLIVREDIGGVNPDNLAALAATWLSIAQRMSSEVGQGTLREATTRSGGGSVTIYAVAGRAVLVIIGDEGLDTSLLRQQAQPTLDAIRALITGGVPHAQVGLAAGPGQASAIAIACSARPTPAPTTVPLIRMNCRSRPSSSSSWVEVSVASQR